MPKKISVQNVYPALLKRMGKAIDKFLPDRAREISHTNGIVAFIAATSGIIAKTI